MELAGGDVPLPDCRGHRGAGPVHPRRHAGWFGGIGGIGMHEVDPGRRLLGREQGAGFGGKQGGPAHVGNRLARRARQRPHPPGQQAKTGGLALITGLEQQLQAQADAEQGLAGRAGPLQGGGQTTFPQPLHGRIEGPHPRQHQGIASGHCGGVVNRLHRGAEPFEGALHRVQVAHAVIDQSEARHGGDQACGRVRRGWPGG